MCNICNFCNISEQQIQILLTIPGAIDVGDFVFFYSDSADDVMQVI